MSRKKLYAQSEFLYIVLRFKKLKLFSNIDFKTLFLAQQFTKHR